MTAEEAVRGEHQRQGVTQVSVANAITSLRLCSEIDWREFVESVSLVEHALRRDPAGVYGRMDFLSRDEQRHAVEQIAAPSGEAQVQLALKAVESARQAAARGSATDRAAHVGYHLVGPGRRTSKPMSRYRPPLGGARAAAGARGHPTLLYLGVDRRRDGRAAASPSWLGSPGADRLRRSSSRSRCWSLPALDIAIALVQRLVAWAVAPRRLPRLDFSDGVPDDARTMVVVPTLLASADGGRRRCSSTWKCWRTAIWIRASTSPS